MFKLVIFTIVAGLVIESHQQDKKESDDGSDAGAEKIYKEFKAPKPTVAGGLSLVGGLSLAGRLPFGSRPRYGRYGPAACWTDFFDIDDPSGSGDYELLVFIQRRFPAKVCKKPLYIEARTTDTNAPADTTGEILFLHPAFGLLCRNWNQRDRRCRDYKVRFGCPCKC